MAAENQWETPRASEDAKALLVQEEKQSPLANMLSEVYDWGKEHKTEIGITAAATVAVGLLAGGRGLINAGRRNMAEAYGPAAEIAQASRGQRFAVRDDAVLGGRIDVTPPMKRPALSDDFVMIGSRNPTRSFDAGAKSGGPIESFPGENSIRERFAWGKLPPESFPGDKSALERFTWGKSQPEGFTYGRTTGPSEFALKAPLHDTPNFAPRSLKDELLALLKWK